MPGRVAALAHQSVGAAYAAAGKIAALGHPALGLALHHAATNAFLRGLTIGVLVASGVAAVFQASIAASARSTRPGAAFTAGRAHIPYPASPARRPA